jgi:hypothetical protein
VFRFKIDLHVNAAGPLAITFTQVFTSISEQGNTFLNRYRSEDYAGRLKSLEEFMIRHLEDKRRGRRPGN